MKIGILTYHWANNYGAVIQAYALLSKLKELGHDAYIIDRRIVYRGILRKLYHKYSYSHFLSWRKFHKERKLILNPITNKYTSYKQLFTEFKNENFDGVIVGSDQIWRWKLIGNNYFLDFLEGTNVKRYSYAASFGIDEWQGSVKERKIITSLLKKFDAISVRERTGIDICNNTFGVNAKLVLDPTLLHNRFFYENTLLKNMPQVDNGKVVSYILGSKYKKQTIEIAKWAINNNLNHNELYWTSIDIPSIVGYSESHFEHVSISEWLNEIRNAKYVITNSFHATVFSILFEKQFVVLENQSGGKGRLQTLFESLDISNRMVNNVGEIESVLQNKIDYNLVKKKHSELIPDSVSFLLNL